MAISPTPKGGGFVRDEKAKLPANERHRSDPTEAYAGSRARQRDRDPSSFLSSVDTVNGVRPCFRTDCVQIDMQLKLQAMRG